MPKYTNIQEVNELDTGQVIGHLRATIKSAFMPSKGTSEYGKWKVQAATLQDEAGDEIRASFWNLFDDDLRDYQGKVVDVSSVKSDKHGFIGVTAEDWTDKKTGKVQRQLKVSENANVEFQDKEDEGDERGVAAKEVSGGGSTYNSVKLKDNPIIRKYDDQEGVVKSDTPNPIKVRPADETRASIERQVSLKSAVDLAVAEALPGDRPVHEKVLDAATLFYKFLSNGNS